jgi:CubicO group peptidase (beta-lactamase class C family)
MTDTNLGDVRAAHRVGARWLVAALVFVSATAAAASADFAAIDAYIATQRTAQHIPGLALAMVAPDGTIHLGGFGAVDASGPAVTSHTPFIIGSTSKSFTALATMQLVEAGRVELDAPVQRYLPWFRVADPEASARITVRDALNQTSGLSTASGRRTLMEYSSGDDALQNRVRGLRDVALTTAVGRTYQYSNCNYQILGAIVEAVSGQSFEAYVQQHIFDPLGMNHTYTSKSAAVANGLAMGHRSLFGHPIAYDEPVPRGSVPSGFIISTAEDMSHYLSAQLNGGRWRDAAVLSPAGIAEMHRGAARIGDGDAYYAMGWNAGLLDGMPAVWHGGDTFGYQSFMVLLPDVGWGAVMLANMNDIPSNARFAEILTGALDLATGRPPRTEHVSDAAMVHAVVFAIVALQILGMARTARLFALWRREPTRRPRGPASLIGRVALPSLTNALWGGLVLIAIPLTFAPLAVATLGMPGLAHLLIASGAVALGWAALRPWLALRGWRARS